MQDLNNLKKLKKRYEKRIDKVIILISIALGGLVENIVTKQKNY